MPTSPRTLSRPGRTGTTRREFVRRSLSYYSSLLALPYLSACSDSGDNGKTMVSNLGMLGPLGAADGNDCRLPAGFSSRIVARSSQPVLTGSDFLWHTAPDGGACFADGDGWIYVSNSEALPYVGGASALRFDSSAHVVDAYPILQGTAVNCAGGATPYGTWLSCEEFLNFGRVFECDPRGIEEAVERPALGYFQHEAVAYDVDHHVLYLTEDRSDGGLYRFTPSQLTAEGYADLSAGLLEVARITLDGDANRVDWLAVPDPQGQDTPTRYQVQGMATFDGGEGIEYFDGRIAFTTKGDNRVWVFDVEDSTISILYDEATSDTPILSGVDNITVNFAGDYLVAEDGGNMQIVVLTQDGRVAPLVELVGQAQSEITGPAFSPDGTRLYFSSQRGRTGHPDDGLTYEITGPFFTET